MKTCWFVALRRRFEVVRECDRHARNALTSRSKGSIWLTTYLSM